MEDLFYLRNDLEQVRLELGASRASAAELHRLLAQRERRLAEIARIIDSAVEGAGVSVADFQRIYSLAKGEAGA